MRKQRQVGDLVHIKTINQIEKDYHPDGDGDVCMDGIYFVWDMYQFLSIEFKIKRSYIDIGGRYRYALESINNDRRLNLELDEWTFSEEMFQTENTLDLKESKDRRVKEKKLKKQFKAETKFKEDLL